MPRHQEPSRRRRAVIAAVAALAASSVAHADFWLIDQQVYDSNPDESYFLGTSVSLANDLAIAGVPNSDYWGVPGVAQFYWYDGANWQHLFYAMDGSLGLDARFGWDVDLETDGADVTTAISAPYANSGYGAVVMDAYNSSGGWVQTDRDVLQDASGASGDWFGFSVDHQDNYLVVGAPGTDDAGASAGMVVFYQRSGTSWTEMIRYPGTSGASLGWSVAIDGEYAIVGAPTHDYFSTVAAGSARVYKRSGAAWVLVNTLRDPSPIPAEHFGDAVAIEGDLIAVGATNPGSVGSVHLFRRSSGTDTWSFEATILSSDLESDDGYGHSIDIDNGRVLVGAPHNDSGSVAGAGTAYLFEKSGGSWSQTRVFYASDRATDDDFGFDVAIHGCDILIGARGDDDMDDEAGAGYFYRCYESGSFGFELIPWPLQHSIFGVGTAGSTFGFGAVTTNANTNEQHAAVTFDPDEGWMLLPDLGGPSAAFDGGQTGEEIVLGGGASTPGGIMQPVLYRGNAENGFTLQVIDTLGQEGGELRSIAKSPEGTYVGVGYVDVGPDWPSGAALVAGVWPGGQSPMVALPSFPQGDMSAAHDVIYRANGRAFAVGRAIDGQGRGRAVRWSEENGGWVMTAFPIPHAAVDSAAHEALQTYDGRTLVCGDYLTSAGARYACLWIKDGQSWQRTTLPRLDGHDEAAAFSVVDIDDIVYVVGVASNGPGSERGIIWTYEPQGISDPIYLLDYVETPMPGMKVDNALRILPSMEIAAWIRPEDGSGYTESIIISPIAATSPPPCPEDLDGDMIVGFNDLVQMLALWGPCSGCSADLDGSGDIGFPDLVILLAAWGPC